MAHVPARAPRSRPPDPPARPRVVLVEIHRGALGRNVPRAGTFVRQAPGAEPLVLEPHTPRHVPSAAPSPPRVDALWVPARVADTRRHRAPRHALAQHVCVLSPQRFARTTRAPASAGNPGARLYCPLYQSWVA